MPTTVTKTIGTSGDYTTPQAWEDAIPASIVTTDELHVGQLKKQDFSGAGTRITFAGVTTDATRYIQLECEAGASFRDDASVQTNPLRVDATKGATLTNTDQNTETVSITSNHVHVRGVQIRNTGAAANSNRAWYMNSTGNTGTVLEFCMLEASSALEYTGAVLQVAGVIRNCCVIQRAGSAGSAISVSFPGTGMQIINCTLVRPSDLTAAHEAVYSDATPTTAVKNCALFGFTNSANVAARFTGSNNCSDVAIGFGTSNQASKTYANQFVTTTNAASDFRLKAGADCLDTGVTDTTHGPIDIAGTSRPQQSAYDIGCWEWIDVPPVPPVTVGAWSEFPKFLLRR